VHVTVAMQKMRNVSAIRIMVRKSFIEKMMMIALYKTKLNTSQFFIVLAN